MLAVVALVVDRWPTGVSGRCFCSARLDGVRFLVAAAVQAGGNGELTIAASVVASGVVPAGHDRFAVSVEIQAFDLHAGADVAGTMAGAGRAARRTATKHTFEHSHFSAAS